MHKQLTTKSLAAVLAIASLAYSMCKCLSPLSKLHVNSLSVQLACRMTRNTAFADLFRPILHFVIS